VLRSRGAQSQHLRRRRGEGEKENLRPSTSANCFVKEIIAGCLLLKKERGRRPLFLRRLQEGVLLHPHVRAIAGREKKVASPLKDVPEKGMADPDCLDSRRRKKEVTTPHPQRREGGKKKETTSSLLAEKKERKEGGGSHFREKAFPSPP